MSDELIAMKHYSAALDEIFRLRRALAYEAMVTRAHLGYKTFPRSRRDIAEDQVQRMRLSARGGVTLAYAGQPGHSLTSAMVHAEAPPTLTRWEWERSRRDRG